jgi:hypothetical protein
MPLHGMWVSGHVAQPAFRVSFFLENVRGQAWSDVAGDSHEFGMSFRGKPGLTNFFNFTIPTPAIAGDVGTRLLKSWSLTNSGSTRSANLMYNGGQGQSELCNETLNIDSVVS